MIANRKFPGARILKCTLSIYFMLMALSLIALRNSPNTGYELSIFTYTPSVILVFLIGGDILGLVLIIRQAILDIKGKKWLIGFILLILGNSIFLAIPNYRGYFLYWGSDPIAQLGWTNDILNTTRIGSSNQYPFTHILMAQVAGVGGISVIDLLRYLPIYISVLYMIFIYFLATSIFEKSRYAILAAATSAPLLFSTFQGAVYPQTIAHIYLPLLLYFYFESRRMPSLKFRVPLIILMISYPFWHPVTAITVIVGLIILELIRFGFNYLSTASQGQKISWREFALYPSLISFTILFTWLSRFTLFDVKVRDVWQVLLGLAQEHGQVQRLTEQIILTGWDLYVWFFKFHGHIILYIALSIVGAIIIFKKVRKRHPGMENLLALLLFGIIGEVFVFSIFWTLRMTTVFRFIRLDNLIYLTPIFVAFALIEIIDWLKLGNNKKIVLLVALLIAAVAISYSAHYYTPWINVASPQLTWSEYSGSGWILDHRQSGIYWNGLSYSHVWPYLFVGYHETHVNMDILNSMNRIVLGITLGYLKYPEPPPHLGYDKYNVMGRAILEIPDYQGLYFVVTQRFFNIKNDPVLSEKSMNAAHLARADIDFSDLEKLYKDYTVDRLYSNGAMDMYYIRPFYY